MRYADVDLTSGAVGDYIVPSSWTERYLGGRGIGLRILLEEMRGDEDALGPENILVFACGPLQGTGIAGAGRHAVISKSPKTNALNDSYAGGFWAHELATSGFDGLIIRGQASSPVYLYVHEGKVDIISATSLWGSDIAKTDQVLKDAHPGARITAIGPAGENLVKFACIMNDISRAAGRPGFGAVMGSKKLKAVAVKGGNVPREYYDSELLAEVRRKISVSLVENEAIQQFGKWGSSGSVLPLNELGILPTKNFREGVFDSASAIDGAGPEFGEILVGRDSCTGCPIRCKRVVLGDYKGRPITKENGGPEYETLAALGSYCMNGDVRAISLANQLCNIYGLDTISTGVSIAFAMEASERGLIREKLDWGDPDTIVQLVEDIAYRRGLGGELAKGVDALASELNADFAMHIKGQELPMHDPRGKVGLGLSYATTPRGGQHMEALHDPAAEMGGLGKYGVPEIGVFGPLDRFSWDRKARFIKIHQDLASFANSAIACDYVGWDAAMCLGFNPYPHFREAIYAVTGDELGVPEMLLIGERNFNLLKLAAAQQGYSRKHDDLPIRLKEPLPRGNSAGRPISTSELQDQISSYYELRGWDEVGPTQEKLRQLGMQDLAGLVSSMRD